MFRRDWLQNAIEQLAAALARAAGLSRAGHDTQALEALREAKGGLPLVPGLLEDVPVQSLIDSLGVEQAELLARLLAAEADLLDRMGRSLLAERPRRRSRELFERLGKAPGAG